MFWLHFTPIKITLNSIWMSWSTVLSRVPINNGKKCCILLYFPGLQLYNSHFNQSRIRLRTATALTGLFGALNEREIFFGYYCTFLFFHSFRWNGEKKNKSNNEWWNGDTCDCRDLRFSYFEEPKREKIIGFKNIIRFLDLFASASDIFTIKIQLRF